MNLYCIYDKLACESGPLFEAKNDSVAFRMIKNHIEAYNPEEYKLICLGFYEHDPPGLFPANPYREVLGKLEFVEDEQKEVD